MRIGFIGLGQMGRGMAERLLERGHELVVWNRTRAATQALEERGAHAVSHAEHALQAEVVITMLADDVALETVWVDPDLPRRMPASTVHLNMASVSLAMARRLTALHATCDKHYVSAPVFGRPHAARLGALDIIAAGPREPLTRCVPLFEALGKRWFDLGSDAAQANIVKIARNYLLGTIVESLGEAFALVAKSGVEPARFLDIITSTSMSAPAYRNYGRMIIETPEEPTFTLKLGMKDVELALQAGDETGVPMPMAGVIRDQHAAAIARGYGERDWAALGNYIAEQAGL
jgi:3-hydroxyisobutyrate dehydrogenase-like beta-hydroxyacid dehydrogenase